MRHVRRLALITPPAVLLTRTPYAVVMSPFEKVIHTEKPAEELKEQPNHKKLVKLSPVKEKGFLDKIKGLQLHHRRNARDESIVFSRTHAPSMEKILQAYEDLQQTIERIRVRNTSASTPISEAVSEELLTERKRFYSLKVFQSIKTNLTFLKKIDVIAITEKAKDDDEKSLYHLSGDALNSFAKKSKSSLEVRKPSVKAKPSAKAIASVGKICDDTELDFKLKEIFSRFPSKRRDGMGTIRFQEQAVTQSLHGDLYEKPDRDVSMFCKSAHALLNDKFASKEIDIEADDVTGPKWSTLDEKLAFFFHSLSFWKPFTEELIEESIKIFAEMKKEPDRKPNKKHEKHNKKSKNNSHNNLNGAKSAIAIEHSERIKNIDTPFSEMELTEAKEAKEAKKSSKSLGSGKSVHIGKTTLLAKPTVSSSTESEKSLQEKFLNSEILENVSSLGDFSESEVAARETVSLSTIPPIGGSYSFTTQLSKTSKITIENKRRSWISKVCSWMVKKPEGSSSTETSTPDTMEVCI